ncbi:MAG TPA: hypothetical protein VFG30_28010 [Polyangiales bacterium]|nr:hypothetical protein [Polyangiales bacterium]
MKIRTSLAAVGLSAISLALSQPAAALEFGELSVVRRSESRADLFGIDAGDRSVAHMWQSEATGPWVGPESLSGAALDVTAVDLIDDRFEVFAADSGNEIVRTGQDYDTWAWQAWTVLPGQAKRVAAAKASDGRIGLFYVGTDDAIWYGTRATPEEPFTDWVSFGFTAKDVAVTAADGGAFTVYTLGADDSTSVARIDPASAVEPVWENLGGQGFSLSALRTSTGVDAVAVIGADSAAYVQQRSAAGWSGWANSGALGVRAELAEIDGLVSLLVLSADSGVSRADQTVEGGWSAWEPVIEASPLETTFKGTAVVSIPDQDVKEDRSIELGIRFDVSRRRVTITSFPPITTESFDTPFGSTTSTVTLTSSSEGTFDPESGALEIPVTLQFDQSLDVPLINEDVRASFALSTAPPGAALDRETGTVALAAESTFDSVGGGVNPLAGLDVSVVISGVIDRGL